jgi:hypothetical protein
MRGGTPRVSGPFPVPGDGRSLPGFPGSYRVRAKTPMGGGKLRPRWRMPSGHILEWDYQHGTVEVYDGRGNHLGEHDAHTGQQTGRAVAGRTVTP